MATVIAVKDFYVKPDYVAVNYTIDELAASVAVTSSAVREKVADGSLSASADIVSSISAIFGAGSTPGAQADITAVPTGVLAALIQGFANADLTGSANLDASATGTLPAIAGITTDAVVLEPIEADSSIGASAGLTSTANAILVADSSLPGVVGIVSEASVTFVTSATLSASATINADGIVVLGQGRTVATHKISAESREYRILQEIRSRKIGQETRKYEV